MGKNLNKGVKKLTGTKGLNTKGFTSGKAGSKANVSKAKKGGAKLKKTVRKIGF